MPGRHNSSSIEGGIFAEVTVTQQQLPRAHTNFSSIQGGIFGTDDAARPVTPRNAITKSSIEGGVFGGQPVANENAGLQRQKAAPVKHEHTAGMPARTIDTASREYAAPLNSARSDPNKSSIQGGIFGGSQATPAKSVPRSNPNASSIEGGIFG